MSARRDARNSKTVSLQDARASPTASRNFVPVASSTSSPTARARQYIKEDHTGTKLICELFHFN